MNLTTPVLKDKDIVFPGENWFFYWKTSSALWKSKILDLQNTSKIIIPINWAFHIDLTEEIDFGSERPETNLKALASIIEESGREIIFYLPLNPAPFLHNGGVPAYLARDFVREKNGLIKAFFDPTYQVNRSLSFFASSVFQSFNTFVIALGKYFIREKINCSVWGLESGYLEENTYVSTLEDRSSVFKDAFHRFLHTQNQKENFLSIDDVEDEESLMREFTSIIKNLYAQIAREGLNDHWDGILQYNFLGANQESFYTRLFKNENLTHYTNNIFKSLNTKMITSSVLLPDTCKTLNFKKILQELIVDIQVKTLMDNAKDFQVFNFLKHFQFIYCSDEEQEKNIYHHQLNNLGIIPFLDVHYRGSYFFSHFTDKVNSTEEYHDQEIFFILGDQINSKNFLHILKIFLNGGKILLEQDGLDEKFQKKLEVFFLENNLVVTQGNFYTSIMEIQLGNGRLLMFKGDVIQPLPEDEKKFFWQKIISLFKIIDCKIKVDDGLNFIWLTRGTSPDELKYTEIRRICVYNQTSYKKKILFKLPKNFVALKILNKFYTEVKILKKEILLKLLPSGSIQIDFGVYF